MSEVYYGDNFSILKNMKSESIDLIYIDPPFNTGKTQSYTRISTVEDKNGDRIGFGGKRYTTKRKDRKEFIDTFEDYLVFLEPRLYEAYRILKSNGSLYFHIDYREVHYCKILLDTLFGRECFLNEIIWAYDFGGKPKNKWPPKHDNILLFVKDPKNYIFNIEEIDRIPYMAPGLVGPEKAARGKLPTDTWWHTIVGTNAKERTGYPTQKPQALLERIIRASSNKGDTVLDFFAGSGTVGAAAYILDRKFILVDNNKEAIRVMKTRFQNFRDVIFIE